MTVEPAATSPLRRCEASLFMRPVQVSPRQLHHLCDAAERGHLCVSQHNTCMGECLLVCYNKDRAVSPARLVRGLIGAHNERPHGDSKVPPYSVKARLGLMRSALAGVHCDQREDRV